MPLMQIRRKTDRISDPDLIKVVQNLPAVAAQALSCKEGGELKSGDIMLEIDEMSPLDANCKDLHIRVWAHDYPSRRGESLANLDAIRKRISAEVLKHLPAGVSWYVWVLLAPTSYGSDTEG